MGWAEQAGREDWSEGPIHGDSAFSTFVTLESIAISVEAFGSTVIPGLVQSPSYQRRRIEMLGVGKDVAVRTESVRMARQHATIGRVPLAMVIDEAALHRDHGGKEGQQQQLAFLCDLDTRPNVSIRYVPYSAGPHLGGLGEFTVLRFDEAIGEPPLVYVETYFGGEYRTSSQALVDAERRFAALRDLSVPIKEFTL
jgi:hypothetical protein